MKRLMFLTKNTDENKNYFQTNLYVKRSINLCLIAALLVLNCGLKAQETPVKYNHGWGVELNFNPFDGSLSLNNAAGQIKVRKFLNDTYVIRSAFSIEYKNNEESRNNPYGQNPYTSSYKRHSSLFAIGIGAEKHFNTGRRLSPYIGFDIGGGIKSSEFESKYNNSTTTLKGAWVEYGYYYLNGNQYNDYVISERGYKSVNASIITGFDFYIADNFYIGYEFGFGFEYFKFAKIEQTTNPPTDPNYQFINYADTESKSWKIGPKLLNGIRIGYNF